MRSCHRIALIVAASMLAASCGGGGAGAPVGSNAQPDGVCAVTPGACAPSRSSWIEGPRGWTFSYQADHSANQPYEYAIVDYMAAPVRFGWKSERFEVRTGDCSVAGGDCGRGNERSEVTADSSSRDLAGSEVWYGWSIYIPPDWKDGGSANFAGVVLGQFGYDLDPNTHYWLLNFKKLTNGDFVVAPSYGFAGLPTSASAIANAAEFAGRWYDIVVHSKWSGGADGFHQVWVNDQRVLDYSGATLPAGATGAYFKYGVYRPAASGSTVAYFDEVRRGAQRADVDIRMIQKAAN